MLPSIHVKEMNKSGYERAVQRENSYAMCKIFLVMLSTPIQIRPVPPGLSGLISFHRYLDTCWVAQAIEAKASICLQMLRISY